MAAAAPQSDDDVTVNTEITPDRTVISVSGTKDAAVVVHSDSGERIYLPPERSDSDDDDTSYRSGDNPYEGMKEEGPYTSNRQTEATEGLNETANGFRIVHTEPVTDIRFLR